jgi:hypothetical protein
MLWLFGDGVFVFCDCLVMIELEVFQKKGLLSVVSGFEMVFLNCGLILLGNCY